MAKKILTLEKLLEEKKIINPKKWEFECEEFDDIIKIEKVAPSKISSIAKDMQEGKIDDYTACQMAIFESVPMFKAKELREQYSVAEPFEVVDAVFDRNIGLIYTFGNRIFANYGLVEVKDDIKKQ